MYCIVKNARSFLPDDSVFHRISRSVKLHYVADEEGSVKFTISVTPQRHLRSYAVTCAHIKSTLYGNLA